MQRVSHRSTGVYSLPVELLTRIFTLGADYEYPYAESPFLLKPDQHYYAAPSSNFQLLASHVCQQWRQIALRTSSLWTGLHFREPSHLHRAAAFLARCSGSSVRCFDILVDTVAKEDHIPGVTLYKEELHAVFRLIVPHVARWRAFHLKIRDNDCKGVARFYLGSCGPAPNLETLQLYHFEDYRTSQNLYLATYRPPVVVFNNALPKLKNVSLIGVNLPWEKSPYLVGLRNLELALHSDNIRPPYEYWESMIRGSPELQKLSLHYSGPRVANGDQASVWPGTKERIYVHSLEELSLTDLDPDYLCLLMERLVLPSIERLSIDLPDQDFTPFVELISCSQDVGADNADILDGVLSTPLSSPSSTSTTPTTSVTSNQSTGESHTHSVPAPVVTPAAVGTTPHNVTSPVSTTSTIAPPYLAYLMRTPFPFIARLHSLNISALECSVEAWRTLLGVLEGLQVLEVNFARVGKGFLEVLMEGRMRAYTPQNDWEEGKESTERKMEGGGTSPSDGVQDISPEEESETPKRHVPYLPNLSTFRLSGLSGSEASEMIAYREGCAPEYHVKRWVVKWCEGWRGRDATLDDLVERGWRGEDRANHSHWVKVEWISPEEEEDEDEDEEGSDIDDSMEEIGNPMASNSIAGMSNTVPGAEDSELEDDDPELEDDDDDI